MSDGHPLDEEEEEEGMKGSSITALLHLELLGEGGGRAWQVKVSSGGKLLLLHEEVNKLEEVVSAETRRKPIDVDEDMEEVEEELGIAGCLIGL